MCALVLVPAEADARTVAPPDERRVVLALLPTRLGSGQATIFLKRLAARPALTDLGLVSAAQGRFHPTQAMLDLSQGTRTSFHVYDPQEVSETALSPWGDGGGVISGHLDLYRRAESAPEDIVPGLLASSIPGGAGYAGVGGRPHPGAIAAANRDGFVAEVSLGAPDDLAARTSALVRRRRLVVVGLPARQRGGAVLDQLLAARRPGDLLIVMRQPPERGALSLLGAGVAGLGGEPGLLTSETTRRYGVVAITDLFPMILRHLRLRVPSGVKGQAVRSQPPRDAEALESLQARLGVVGSRRLPSLEAALVAWIALILLLGTIRGPPGIRQGMRIGGLGALWLPSVFLLTSVLQPGRQLEMVIVAFGCMLLGALNDRFLPWPRGPLVPAAVGLVLYTADLANGSDVLVGSLLGPNPRFGARFYGVGNELEAVLTVLLLVGLAAVPGLRERSRRSALVFAIAGLALGVVIGSGRLGADVGGVITIGASFATATIMMLPGGLTRRALLVAALVPVAAVVVLAGLDLATGGNAHFTRSVLDAESGGALTDTIVRRYDLAYKNLIHGLMPVIAALALLAVAYAIRWRRELYRPLGGSPAWSAALAGSLAGAVVGSLTNDSGPVLLVFGVILTAVVTAYVRGDPRLGEGTPPGPAAPSAIPAGAPPRAPEAEPAPAARA